MLIDWRISRNYPPFCHKVKWHWAWEFLRRNSQYQGDFANFWKFGDDPDPEAALTRDTCLDPFECYPAAEEGESYGAYKAKHGENAPIVSRRDAIRGRWLIEAPTDPAKSWRQLEANPFRSPTRILRKNLEQPDSDKPPVEHDVFLWPGEVFFRVRLFGDLKLQENQISKRLAELKREYLGEQQRDFRLWPEFHLILRCEDVRQEAAQRGRQADFMELRQRLRTDADWLAQKAGKDPKWIKDLASPSNKKMSVEYVDYADRLIRKRQYFLLLTFEFSKNKNNSPR